MSDKRRIGDLQVWWMPQILMEAFTVDVSTVAEGVKLLHVLAQYDRFQYEHGIKPNYCNTGGIHYWCTDSDGEGTPGWEDWYDEETRGDSLEPWFDAQQKGSICP